jgi:phage-related protein
MVHAMTTSKKTFPVQFYRNESGKEPVRKWLLDLTAEERRLIGDDIKTAEYGWPIGMPLVRSMGDGLFEVRTDLPHKKISRVLFCAHKSRMVLLHAFIKKTPKTPKADLELAKSRMKGLK